MSADTRTHHEAMYAACAEALILATGLASATNLPAPADLRQRIVAALDKMVAQARGAGLPEADIAEARYALVAFLDEQVLKSSWVGRSEWMSQPLQLVLYREYTAGENFFTRMRALLQARSRPFALQAYYLCLALGFRGVFGQSGNEQGAIELLEKARGQLAPLLPPANQLSPNARPRERARAVRRSRTLVVGLLSGAVVLTILTVLGMDLSLRSDILQAREAMPSPHPSAARPR